MLALATEVTLPTAGQPPPATEPDPEQIDKAAALLAGAKKPMIFVGGGAVDAAADLLAVGEMLQAPVVSFTGGRGIVSDRHYLAQSGLAGHELWREADVVLAVGTRLHQPQLRWGVDRDLQLIRIDIDPTEIARFFRPALGIVAHAGPALAALRRSVERSGPKRASRRDELEALKARTLAGIEEKLGPQCEYLRAIRAELPDEGVYVEDLTQVGYVGRMAFPVYHPRTYIHSGYQGTLGHGFATALGAKVGRPDLPVVSVSRRWRIHVQRPGIVDRGAARHRHRPDRLCRWRLRQCPADAEGGLRQPADRRRSRKPEFPENGRELRGGRGAHDDPGRVAPGTGRRAETPRHDA